MCCTIDRNFLKKLKNSLMHANHLAGVSFPSTSNVLNYLITGTDRKQGDILLQNISQYLLRVQQMKGYLAGYFGGDHFFMYIPDDEQLINLIYKTIRSYIGIHSQNEGFLPIIGIYPITEKHPDTATMCNNAQLAASEIKGNFNKRICYFTNEIIDQLEKEQQMLHDVKVGLKTKNLLSICSPNATVSLVQSSVWKLSPAGSVLPVVLFLQENLFHFSRITV